MKNLKIILSVVLIFSFVLSASICSYADSGDMSWFKPQPGDDMVYYWEMEKAVQEVTFNDTALCIQFDVGDSGVQHLVSAGWLPDITSNEEAETAAEFDTSFYKYLEGQSEYIESSDIYDMDVDALVEKSGLTPEDAQEKWYKYISLTTENTFPYRVEIYDNYELYGRDVILGAYGAEAISVEEGEIAGYQAILAAIDYSPLYEEKDFSEEVWENIKKSVLKNYIFLFDSECEYMICVSGTTDMETLQKIAENLSVHETQLERKAYNTGINYLFMDMAKG